MPQIKNPRSTSPNRGFHICINPPQFREKDLTPKSTTVGNAFLLALLYSPILRACQAEIMIFYREMMIILRRPLETFTYLMPHAQKVPVLRLGHVAASFRGQAGDFAEGSARWVTRIQAHRCEHASSNRRRRGGAAAAASADPATTLGIYGHVLGDDQREAMGQIESVLSQP